MSALPSPFRAPWPTPATGPRFHEPDRLDATTVGRSGGAPTLQRQQLLAAQLDQLFVLMARLDRQQPRQPLPPLPSRHEVERVKADFQEALHQLAALLCQPHAHAVPTPQPTKPAAAKPRDAAFIARAQSLAQAQLGNCLFGVNELAEAMTMTRRHLARRFAELIGRPPSQWLSDLRLTRAEQLLRDGKLNVSEVAGHVGFAKPSYFAQRFKCRYGCTPSAYRRQFMS